MRFFAAIAIALSSISPAATGALFTYDFPGSPGSGLAVDQTNPQPSGATFSDFTRNGNLVGLAAANQFDSNNWTGSATIDQTQFDAFSITAGVGRTLDLTQLGFDVMRINTGPLNAQVALYLNGSTTPYATMNFAPPTTITTMTFNFTALTDADNVTTATFKFFGWNSTPSAGSMRFDNVATFGTIGMAVPEPSTFLPGLFAIGIALVELVTRRVKRGPRCAAATRAHD
jgi:hypothetical protein